MPAIADLPHFRCNEDHQTPIDVKMIRSRSFAMPSRIACLVVCLVLATGANAGYWPNWRGPGFDGVVRERTDFPIHWSKSENILWKANLPGKGASTPIVWGDRIILTCAIEGRNGVLCLDPAGKPVWQKTVGKERAGKHVKATGCNPSATTDGKLIYAYFKSGDLACLDYEGKTVWQHNLQEMFGADTLWWDLGSSPVLTRENIVVAVMHSGPSFLVAFDRASGKQSWKHDRNLDAPKEAAQSYSTPVVLADNSRETIVVLGADHVTAHDAADGHELWRVGGLNPTSNGFFRSIASPVVLDGIVVAPYARGSSLTAIRLGGSGDVTASQVAWMKAKLGSDVPTPAAVDGKVYVCNDRGELSCLDVHSGNLLWSGQVERSGHAFSSSPVIAGGKIYLTREDGKTFVVEQGNEFKLMSVNELDEGEFVVATPVFVDGRILIRTLEHLYCIGR
jgi:outer membrane protein assembly factor BamB